VKASEWKRAASVVAAVLPEYRQSPFGFVRSDEWIAAGYYVDSSAFSSAAFYVQAFVMPRFVPADSLYFDYGFRVNGRWEEVGPELAEAIAAAEPRLAEVATIAGASDWQRNINHTEVRLSVAVLTRNEDVDDQGCGLLGVAGRVTLFLRWLVPRRVAANDRGGSGDASSGGDEDERPATGAEAIIIWTGFGETSSPSRDDSRVVAALGAEVANNGPADGALA
jgi:hypothetical protein